MNYHYFPCLSCNKFFLLLIKLQKKFVTRLPLKITATKKIALKIKFSFLLLIQNNCLPTTNVPFEVLNQIVNENKSSKKYTYFRTFQATKLVFII